MLLFLKSPLFNVNVGYKILNFSLLYIPPKKFYFFDINQEDTQNVKKMRVFRLGISNC